jgi:hypothetical protein
MTYNNASILTKQNIYFEKQDNIFLSVVSFSSDAIVHCNARIHSCISLQFQILCKLHEEKIVQYNSHIKLY